MRFRVRILGALVVVLAVILSSNPLLALAQGRGAAGPGNGRYIVVFDDSVDPGPAAADLAQRYGIAVSHVYGFALKGFAGEVPAGRLLALQRDPRVRYVEADQPATLFQQDVPTGIQRMFASANAQLDIDGSDDYRVDVGVAVIDTGVDVSHPDLNVVFRTNCAQGGPFGQNCTDGDGNDGNGHGTHVGGTIAALDNGIGVVGVAPGARLYSVKVLRDDGSGWYSWIIAGVDKVTAKSGEISVANMSLGGGNSTALCNAISNSVAKGVVYAVAAGNSDADAKDSSPANCADVITVSALADFDGAAGGLIGTTASPPYCRVDQDDTLANFSNWGSRIDVAAPGVCILSTWSGGGYNTISGTSMASPHVAGAAALLASVSKPTNKTQALAIRQTIVNNGNFAWTDDSGDGIKEPMLDVSNATVFNPTVVAGSGGGNANTPPTAHNVSTTTNQATAIAITLGGSDQQTCDLAFSIVSGPSNGSLSAISNSACSGTGPYADSASVTYTPNANFSGADSFTYKVNDGAVDSNDATVSITVVQQSTGFSLTATGYKVKGVQRADLTWSGANSTGVDVYRSDVSSAIITTSNDGTYTDVTGRKGGGTYTYKVCEAGTTICSNEATVTW